MTQIQQRRWFRTKKIAVEQDNDIIVSEKSLFGSQEQRFRVFDMHPFCERYRNNALGYLFAALGLMLLALLQGVSSWQQGGMTHSALGVFTVLVSCSGVVFTLTALHRLAKYDFFHRNGKVVFSIWRKLGRDPHVEQFVDQLLEMIKSVHQDRFVKARTIVNKKIRHQTAEEAIYLLYRQGLLDITEMETLLVNSENKYNPSFVSFVSPEAAKSHNNVIDLRQYARENVNE